MNAPSTPAGLKHLSIDTLDAYQLLACWQDAFDRGDRLDPVEGRDDRARGNCRSSIGEVIDPRVVHSVGAWFADAVVRLGGRRRRYAAGAGQELLERAHRIIDLCR